MTQKEYDNYVQTHIMESKREQFDKYIYAMLEIEGCDISDIKSLQFDNETNETMIFYHEGAI